MTFHDAQRGILWQGNLKIRGLSLNYEVKVILHRSEYNTSIRLDTIVYHMQSNFVSKDVLYDDTVCNRDILK